MATIDDLIRDGENRQKNLNEVTPQLMTQSTTDAAGQSTAHEALEKAQAAHEAAVKAADGSRKALDEHRAQLDWVGKGLGLGYEARLRYKVADKLPADDSDCRIIAMELRAQAQKLENEASAILYAAGPPPPAPPG